MKRSILYFDDDPILLNIFEEMFRHDYKVNTTAALGEARRILSETGIDIIISDLSMPEISGVDFLREVAEKYPSSARILVTGYATAGDVLPEISQGIVQFFMMKPWLEEEMSHVVKRAVALRERLRR